MKDKSRIEILDKWAHRMSRMYDHIRVDTFEDFIDLYPTDKVIMLVYSAMLEYKKGIKDVDWDSLEGEGLDEKLTEW